MRAERHAFSLERLCAGLAASLRRRGGRYLAGASRSAANFPPMEHSQNHKPWIRNSNLGLIVFEGSDELGDLIGLEELEELLLDI